MPGLSAEGKDLELGEHPRFERTWRRIQTIVFGIFGLLVVGALAGLFGAGPLSAGQTRLPATGVTLEYPRFLRARTPVKIVVRPNSSAAMLRIHLDRALVEAYQIEKVAPAPVASGSDADGMTLLFGTTPGATGPITFDAQPRNAGALDGTIAIDGETTHIHQMVWP